MRVGIDLVGLVTGVGGGVGGGVADDCVVGTRSVLYAVLVSYVQ